MKFPGLNATARPGEVGPRESDFEVPLARRSLLEQMAGTFFVIYSYSPVSPTYSSASSLSLFFFHSHAFSLSVRTRMRQHRKRFHTRFLE